MRRGTPGLHTVLALMQANANIHRLGLTPFAYHTDQGQRHEHYKASAAFTGAATFITLAGAILTFGVNEIHQNLNHFLSDAFPIFGAVITLVAISASLGAIAGGIHHAVQNWQRGMAINGRQLGQLIHPANILPKTAEGLFNLVCMLGFGGVAIISATQPDVLNGIVDSDLAFYGVAFATSAAAAALVAGLFVGMHKVRAMAMNHFIGVANGNNVAANNPHRLRAAPQSDNIPVASKPAETTKCSTASH